MMRQLAFKQQSGFTLIEVLVAVMVLSIGLLGLAGLQALSMQSNQSAYQRTQAAILAHALVDEMRINATQDFDGFTASTFAASADCVSETITCSAADMANFSKKLWADSLTSAINGADATVTKTGDVYTIVVTWTDRSATATATSTSLTLNTRL